MPIQRQLTDKTKSQENAIISTQFIMKIITQHVKKKKRKEKPSKLTSPPHRLAARSQSLPLQSQTSAAEIEGQSRLFHKVKFIAPETTQCSS